MDLPFRFSCRTLDLSSTQVMGVLNVTPDSFSDGGQFLTHQAALQRAEEMVSQGASIIDVGGESTRPGAAKVSLQEELDRVCPVVEKITSNLDVVLSVDTSKPTLMSEVIKLGVGMINDVRAFTDPESVKVVAGHDVAICVMHMQGQPSMMQDEPSYASVTLEVKKFLQERVGSLIGGGVSRDRIVVDPGFGFGKTLQHNMQLLRDIGAVRDLGFPVLVGLSRKSMFSQILNKPVSDRLFGSVSAASIAAFQGAGIIRTHDVQETKDAVLVVDAINKLAK